MISRSRPNTLRILAICVGALFGLLTSFKDIGDYGQLSQNHQSTKLHTQRRATYSKKDPSTRNDPNDGIIQDKPKQSPPKPKPTPFKINTSALGPIVNPHPFVYTLEPKNACKDKYIVAYVHTAPDHDTRRAQIRRTWGNSSLYKDTTMKVFFMMGEPATQELKKAIKFEAKQYNDIVLESYEDAYHNLSYKAIGAMRWITKECKQTKFVLKTDDDVFINTFTLIKHLKDLDKAEVNNTGLLMCLAWKKMHVLREGKWQIDESVIPDEFYPVYCSGMGYIMSVDVVEAIYKGSAFVKFFWVDDVYITGMVPKHIGLEHIDISKLFMGRKELEWLLDGPDWYKYIFSHLRDMPFYDLMWKKLEKRGLTEKIPDLAQVVAGKIAVNYGPKKSPELRKEQEKQREKEKEKEKANEEKQKKDKKNPLL